MDVCYDGLIRQQRNSLTFGMRIWIRLQHDPARRNQQSALLKMNAKSHRSVLDLFSKRHIRVFVVL